ncbi:CBS domain-containing protein [Pseudoalteromonas sp. BDTF-M6]|uniref:CBS domain-containing protein n=1 Tax=Pseudoalteromonas sp. BDTF-M6 TaxID=2796132 RepID=UPI001BAFEF9B|nr:CBS domain-containing protein [Pseudoalteromonas sp. BDTF-M6]MBS3799339.1 CBS domain-containing protein [Pseudoalteromonas sp. BDTF-M6]
MFNIKVSDIIKRTFLSISPDLELTAAIDLLLKHQVIGAPVTDDSGKLLGYLSEQDCLAPLTTNSYFCDGRIQVREVMSQDVLTCQLDDSLLDLAARMRRHNLPKRYPVIDQGKVIGMAERSQVLQALSQSYRSCSAA